VKQSSIRHCAFLLTSFLACFIELDDFGASFEIIGGLHSNLSNHCKLHAYRVDAVRWSGFMFLVDLAFLIDNNKTLKFNKLGSDRYRYDDHSI